MGAGQIVGGIGLAAYGPHACTARVLEDASLLRLGGIAFKALCEQYPEAMSKLPQTIAQTAAETLLAGVVCDLFGELDAANWAALLAEVTYLPLKRGDVLIRQGEDADRMFVVVYGRLRIVTQDAGGGETVVDEIGRGDTVGERSLLAGDARSATVYALHDSAVGVITRPLFENLKRQYPEVMTRLTRIALRRVQRRAATPNAFHASDAVGFAVLPVGVPQGGVPLAAFAERLASALSTGGDTTLHLSSARLDRLLGTPGIAQVDADHPSAPMLAAWLQCQEQSHCYVIYEADDGWTPWTERCLGMADRIGRAAGQPQRLHRYRTGAAPAGSRFPALGHGGLAGPLRRCRPPSSSVGPSGRF
jgi:CRP-like cAMP-binding protein